MPSMMSISPPLGHGPVLLRVQNAGQVAHPAGMCSTSRTMIESSYAFCEWMRTLERPRRLSSTKDTSSARIMNWLSCTEESTLVKTTRSGERRGEHVTIRQVIFDSIGLAHVVNAAVGRVVFSFPSPVPVEERVADPLVLEVVPRVSAQYMRERKSGEKRITSTHS